VENCIFCKIISGEFNSWKVYEDEHTFAFLDINPVNEYHTLVIPKKHYENMFDIPGDEAVHVIKAVKKIVDMYSKTLGLENIQIINNSGAQAQQDVFHIHFHIIPRFTGDNQNIKWTPRTELREKFDDLLSRLKC